jgi:AcrR family transcriptional regulator
MESSMAAEKLDTETRQEQIAEAALSIVASHGMKGLSVAAVARRVGIVPSAIYRHFHGKDDVLDAVFDLFRTKIMGNVTAVRGETQDPLERLQRLLMRHVRLIRENEALPRIIFSEEVHYQSVARRARLHGIIRDFLQEVAQIVREGQRAGNVKANLDPKTVSLVFIGLFQPAAVLWHLTGGGFDVTRHARKAWKIFRRAIEAR